MPPKYTTKRDSGNTGPEENGLNKRKPQDNVKQEDQSENQTEGQREDQSEGQSETKTVKNVAGGYKGFVYEIQLILLFMIRACLYEYKFELFTNKKNNGKFGDIVANCEIKGDKKVYCVKAKTCNNLQSITKAQLLSGSDSQAFSLKNHSDAWVNRKDPKDDSRHEFLFCTSVDIESESSNEEVWADVSDDHAICQLFNTKTDNKCIKKLICKKDSDITKKLDPVLHDKIYFVTSQCKQENFDEFLKDELKKLIGNHDIENVFLKLKNEVGKWYKKEHTEKDAFTNSKFLQHIREIALTEIR